MKSKSTAVHSKALWDFALPVYHELITKITALAEKYVSLRREKKSNSNLLSALFRWTQNFSRTTHYLTERLYASPSRLFALCMM